MVLLQLHTIVFLFSFIRPLTVIRFRSLRVSAVCLYCETFQINLETYLLVTLLDTVSHGQRIQQNSLILVSPEHHVIFGPLHEIFHLPVYSNN